MIVDPIRPNGQFLLTRLDTSELYLFETANRNANPIFAYRFPDALSLTGIAEDTPDVFAVIAGNYTLGSGPTPGSWTVWRLDLNGWDPEASTPGDFQVFKITDVPEAAHLKWMTRLSERYVLMSDFRAGVVYRLDVDTGAYEVVIANSLTAAVPQPIFGPCGVNGLHVRNGNLYFTNTGQNIFAVIPIRADGTPAAPPASIIARTAAPLDYFARFTFGAHGDVYLVTRAGNTVVRIPQTGGPQVSIVGRVGRGLFEEPTACAFGKRAEDQGVLFVVTGGVLLAPTPGSCQGRLVAVEVETEN